MSVADSVPGTGKGTATAARMYDYYLGGSHNFPADRQAAEQVLAQIPQIRAMARTNRAFLGRAVRYLAEYGVRQFLDIGSGIPTVGNVHEIAQSVSPDCRVLYGDIDPVAVLEGRQMLAGNDLADAIECDLLAADDLLQRIKTDSELAAVIDLDRPVALVLAAVLHFVPDDEDAYRAVRVLTEGLAPGSWLVISHGAAEGFEAGERLNAAREVYARSTYTATGLRNRAQIMRFFDGFDLVEPGLVFLPQWRPEPDDPQDFVEDPQRAGSLAGVGILRPPLLR